MLTVEIEVTGSAPQVVPGDVRGVDEFVPPLDVFRFPEFLDLAPQAGSGGVPEDQTGAGFLADAEQIQGRAEFPVVPFPCLLLPLYEFLELFRIEEGGSVNPLQ